MQDPSSDDKDVASEALSGGDFSRSDLVMQLAQLEEQLETLRINYEQFFSGVSPYAPEKLEAEVQRSFRKLSKLPSRHAQIIFKARALRHRLGTYTTYWRRIEREREKGVFRKDVFKAQMHEKMQKADIHAKSQKGIAEENLKNLFSSYGDVLEKHGGKRESLDYTAFRNAMIQEAKLVKGKHPDKRISFAVTVESGSVHCKVVAK